MSTEEKLERVRALAAEWATDPKHRNIGPQFACRLYAALGESPDCEVSEA